MSSTEDGGGVRNAERTRRAVLEAAQRVVVRRGTKASLAEIATEAGVTKGGLMHHFPSRDDLFEALVDHVAVRMWEEVMAHVDITENRPGKFTRGYVRALTGGSEYLVETYSATGLLALVGVDQVTSSRVDDLLPDDPDRWNRAFAEDGLPLGRVWVVRYAAEGVAMSIGSPYLTDEQLGLAREELLALAEVDA